MALTQWSAITLIPLDRKLSSDQFDGLCAELIGRGAAGTAVDRAPEITCYLEGDEARIAAFVAALGELHCTLLSVSQVAHENWTGACPDVWEPIRAGSIEIFPVESPTDRRPVPPHAIRIIPGLGFGTGHHTTTRMVLGALCEHFSRTPPQQTARIFDLGTGSGILAIAAARLSGLTVDGNDIEAGAIENARDNIRLNNLEHLVRVSTNPLEQHPDSYGLILANLYGEVLMQLAPQVTRIAAPRATAILSGITEIVWDQVWYVYGAQYGWELLSEQSDNGWMCAVIQRASTYNPLGK